MKMYLIMSSGQRIEINSKDLTEIEKSIKESKNWIQLISKNAIKINVNSIESIVQDNNNFKVDIR